VRSLFLVAASAGCSFLFDPSGIVPAPGDMARTDLHVDTHVDDLSVSADLTPPDDLATQDLSPPADLKPLPDLFSGDLIPCVPGSFLGFFDGGSVDPFDCNGCGCTLDSLITPSETANKFSHQIQGLSETIDTSLLISSANPNNTDYDLYQSQNKFYLEGDFEILLDYQYPGSTYGASLTMYLLGPVADGGTPYAPWAYSQLYDDSTGSTHVLLFTQDRSLDIVESLTSGSLRVRRAGAQLCASIAGHEEVCHANTFQENRVWIQLFAQMANAGCSNICTGTGCCSYSARISNLRLRKGVVRSTP
jgi:hypothetical protein